MTDKSFDTKKYKKFIKQYFLYFPSGDILHSWIAELDNNNISYGHCLNYKDGSGDYYVSSKELDKSNLEMLKDKVEQSLRKSACLSNAHIRIIDIELPFGLDNISNSFALTRDFDKKLVVDSKREEIELLEKLWAIGENKEEDCSKLDWLIDKIHAWEKSNKEKGLIVEFFGSFLSVDPTKDFNKEEDRVIAFGLKDSIMNTLNEFSSEVFKEKEEFLNW
jgi:hypothetical protein